MNPTQQSLVRLTFNKPAVTQYIFEEGGEEVKGLKVQIKDGTVHFLPVAEVDSGDVVPLEIRKRGGAEVKIEGALATDIAKAFKNDAGPFFLLSRQKGTGWLTTKPHPSATSPHRFDAHLRVWNDDHGRMTQSTTRRGTSAAKTPSSAEKPKPKVIDAADFLSRIRQAHRLTADYAEARRPGRPSREITEARELVSAFQQLAAEFGSSEQTGALRDELSTVRAQLDSTRRALTDAEKTIRREREQRESMEGAIRDANELLAKVFGKEARSPITVTPRGVRTRSNVFARTAAVARASKIEEAAFEGKPTSHRVRTTRTVIPRARSVVRQRQRA